MLPVTNDQPPPIWVGHVMLGATDVAKSCDYFVKLGMRHIVSREAFAVLELRGGTHLVLEKRDAPAEGSSASFDIMVEDIDVAWKEYEALGIEPTEIHRGDVHDFFTLRDPSGITLLVNSSHVSEHPV